MQDPRPARSPCAPLKQVDPNAGPPAGATPIDAPTVAQLDALSAANDWDGLRTLLSDDFAFVFGKRRFDWRIYIRVPKTTDKQLPGESKTDEVVVHRDEPDVVWVRATSSGTPRFGPGFVAITWTRIRLTADGSRIREIAGAGVQHVV